jgi:hypothetical protein
LFERSLTALITGYGPPREREVPTKETDARKAGIKAPDGNLHQIATQTLMNPAVTQFMSMRIVLQNNIFRLIRKIAKSDC